MAAPKRSDPLIAMNAVALDTEATGLDHARARIVEIGAVRMVNGRINPDDTLRLLVNPQEPMPAAAQAVHGISDDMLVGAPAFKEAWPQAQAFIGANVWIGHTLGFDIALIERECARAGLPFDKPNVLDTRLLAQVAEPGLSGYTLEILSAWLGVEPAERHAALGDAITTARIFIALLPRLRERGIRTYGEALLACSRLTDVLEGHYRAGWAEVAPPPERMDASAIQRIDSYPYRHRIGDIMHAPALFIAPEASVQEALDQLMARHVSSLFVAPEADGPRLARHCGIVTERDIMRSLVGEGARALELPVRAIMSHPLETVPADSFIYVAIARMNRRRVRHLGVVDGNGEVIGALSARDLLKARAGEALSLGDEINQANNARELALAWSKLPQVCAALVADDLDGRAIAAIISEELCALTSRAAAISEQRLGEEGHGQAPCPYSILVLGSAARGESLLALDQDNAIVFDSGEPDGPEDRWFAMLGERIARILHAAGVPLCKGGVMASNPQWRGSLAQWRHRIATWLERSRPADLLSVDTFFDLRGVHGANALARQLRQDAFDMARDRIAFAKSLVEAAGPSESALGLFGRLKTIDGRIDLKKCGLFKTVSAARALAIRHHILARSTPERLQGVRALGRGADQDLESIIAAQGVFLDLILRQQLADIAVGAPPSNAVEVAKLSRRDRQRLQSALTAPQTLDTLVKDLMF